MSSRSAVIIIPSLWTRFHLFNLIPEYLPVVYSRCRLCSGSVLMTLQMIAWKIRTLTLSPGSAWSVRVFATRTSEDWGLSVKSGMHERESIASEENGVPAVFTFLGCGRQDHPSTYSGEFSRIVLLFRRYSLTESVHKYQGQFSFASSRTIAPWYRGRRKRCV